MKLRPLAVLLPLALQPQCSDDGGATTAATTGSTTTGDATTTSTTAPATTTGDDPTTGASDSGGTTTTTSTTSTTTTTTTETTGDATTTTTTGAFTCDGSGLTPGDHTIMLDHDGIARSAIVHVPPGYDPTTATPLVLNFHGFTGSPEGQVAFSLMNPVADAENFLLVYPAGLYNSWNAGLCCGQAVSDGVDDIGFIRALVERLHDELCIDDTRVYATGMSNGGYISHRLACEATDLFAAVGPVSATVVIDPCVPSRPIPVMMFNGTADFLVPYGGGIYQSANQSFVDWATRNGCTDPPEVTAQVGSVTCETVDECDEGVAVTLCTVEGMGHCWPGTPDCLFGVPNTDISANAALWAFFSQFTLP